jgi:hypothetical protein
MNTVENENKSLKTQIFSLQTNLKEFQENKENQMNLMQECFKDLRTQMMNEIGQLKKKLEQQIDSEDEDNADEESVDYD